MPRKLKFSGTAEDSTAEIVVGGAIIVMRSITTLAASARIPPDEGFLTDEANGCGDLHLP
jgi:hypothetical protein